MPNNRNNPIKVEDPGIPDLIIHHISDLHIGPLQFKAPMNLPFVMNSLQGFANLKLYQDHLAKGIRDLSEMPDLVVCSGDLTSYAAEDEFNQAQDFIQSVVQSMKRKPEPRWRKNAGNKHPYFVVIPGNHDLEWNAKGRAKKTDRYERMAKYASSGGDVLAAYNDATASRFLDLGNELNVCLFLFDTTSLGGIKHPVLEDVISRLEKTYKRLVPSKNPRSRHPANLGFEAALNQLQQLVRQDPGFVEKIDFDVLSDCDIPNNRLKIAVLHHNPTSVPSDAIEHFDTIINAGKLKANLMSKGFDIVLHGHRHCANCTYERTSGPEDSWPQGLFIIGADSLGSTEHAPFLQLKLWDSKGTNHVPPAALVEVTEVKHRAGGYRVASKPFVREVIRRSLYSTMDALIPHLGRIVGKDDEEGVLKKIRQVLPHMESLQRRIGGWEEAQWIRAFHLQLESYSRIWATDIPLRSSLNAPLFEAYLNQQYLARAASLPRNGESSLLYYCKDVIDAIKRTGWRPETTMWGDYALATEPTGGTLQLEVVRIIVREHMSDEARDELVKLNFLHKLFAVPLFVLSPEHCMREELEDFVLGFFPSSEVPRACYQFDPISKVVEPLNPTYEGDQRASTFKGLLANRELRTVDQIIGAQAMLPNPSRRSVFAKHYDDTRHANETLLATLRKELQPSRDKSGLEIGCGTGNYTVGLSKDFGRVVGIDVSPEMIAVAKAKESNVEWFIRSALDSRFESNSFDAIWLISTLHYFKDIHLERLFDECYRMLKPGGRFLADTEFLEQHKSLWLVHFFPSLVTRYRNTCLPEQVFKSMLGNAHFASVKTKTLGMEAIIGDASLRMGQDDPWKYLDPNNLKAIPAFTEMRFREREDGLRRLRVACESGEIWNIMEGFTTGAMPGVVSIIMGEKLAKQL